ncbi:MAG: DUF4422 domain-containing protein [Candidatus Saccharibacteria bacterium]
MDNNQIKIYSFHYKPGPVVTRDPIYIPVFAGKNGSYLSCPIMGDDTGDHISSKNKYFSELTGIYWVWKNQHSDITGSCHYRRFFTNKKEPILYQIKRLLYYPARLYRKRFGLIYTNNVKLFESRILNKNEILEIFESYDAILPLRRKFRYSVREHYRRYHDLRELNLVKEILQERYPEYLPAFESVMNGNRLYANNMFILRQKEYGLLMEWWFEMLFEFERRINITDFQGYQQRIMGFMAERLLTIWFYHQNLKVKELPVIYFKSLKKV